MAFDFLLREGKINSLTVPNRMISGPMERSMANRDGSMNERYIDFLVERARGGAALIMVESTYVDPRGLGHLYQVGCHGDHVIPGLRHMAEAVHAAGGRVGLEIYMGGRNTPAYMSQRQCFAPSVVPCEVLETVTMPREMTLDDLEEVKNIFANAARRIVEAGLDIVELHGAHGYLLCSFLSPFSNRRTDKYGGSLENRARFPLEVLAAVRKVVGPDFPIAYRFSAEEYIEGGTTIEHTKEFAKMLAEAGIDLLDVSGGIYESADTIIQGCEAPKGGFVDNAKAIKKAVGDKVPVSVAQRLNVPELANRVLSEGLDFVTLSRAFHADPHWANKVAEGRIDDIVPCIACHNCTNQLEANLVACCAVNSNTSNERKNRIRPTLRKRKVMVVGGGPGGMNAARILAEQGNQVSLYEKDSELGGQLRYAAMIGEDYVDSITYFAGRLKKLKVEVHLKSPVDLKKIKQAKPDAVVVATGVNPGLSFCDWKGKSKTFDVISAFDRPDEDWEERCVIIGGDFVSCGLALYAAGRGTEVYLVEPKPAMCYDKLPPASALLVATLKNLPTVHFHNETTVEEAGDNYVILQKDGKHTRLEDVGCVIVGGRTANKALYEEILREMPELEVYNIGDSVEPHDLFLATQQAAEVAELVRLRGVDNNY